MSCNACEGDNRILMVRGEDRTLSISIKDENKNLVNLTGGVVTFTVKSRFEDTINSILKSSVSPAQITILNQTTNLGQAEIYIVPSDTQDLAVKNYVYDVWVMLASGKKFAAIRATEFSLEHEVTVL